MLSSVPDACLDFDVHGQPLGDYPTLTATRVLELFSATVKRQLI